MSTYQENEIGLGREAEVKDLVWLMIYAGILTAKKEAHMNRFKYNHSTFKSRVGEIPDNLWAILQFE